MSTTAYTSFEYDVFISYAHLDNQTVGKEAGWVDLFHRYLENTLNGYLGGRARIFRDSRLKGDTFFDESLLETVRSSAVLVTLLSPSFANSVWCKRELDTFVDHAETGIGLKVERASRVYKVVKIVVPPADLDHPSFALYKGVLGYSFCETEADSGTIVEYEVKSREYMKMISQMAQDLSRLLKDIRELPPEPDTSINGIVDTERTVFLSHPASDLKDVRERVATELVDAGYHVVPDQPLPEVAEEIEQAIHDYLSQSTLAVLLVGERRGLRPYNTDLSMTQLQYRFIRDSPMNGALGRIVWMPHGLPRLPEPQQVFVEEIKSDLNTLPGMQLIESSVEDLKTNITDELERRRKKQETRASSTRCQVYIVFDRKDLEDATILELTRFFTGHGLSITFPDVETDSEEGSDPMQEHYATLETCDAVVIYYGNANDSWRRAKVKDLEKMSGIRKNTPVEKVLYVGPAKTLIKQMAAEECRPDLLVIENYEQFTPDELAAFLERVKAVCSSKGIPLNPDTED